MKTKRNKKQCLPLSCSWCFFPYWFPSSNLFPCVEAVYFVSFFHEATIRWRTVHTVVRGTDQFTHLCVLHIGWRYAWLCFQKVRFHSADATTIPVGSFRRDLWMFLYEAYFVCIFNALCVLACENSRPSSLLAEWRFARRTSAIHRRKFHTDDENLSRIWSWALIGSTGNYA